MSNLKKKDIDSICNQYLEDYREILSLSEAQEIVFLMVLRHVYMAGQDDGNEMLVYDNNKLVDWIESLTDDECDFVHSNIKNSALHVLDSLKRFENIAKKEG